MTVDSGGAPCIHNGQLSLAICKPAIRRTAKSGDYILGFAANSLYENNCLIYVAKVGNTLSGQEYYARKYQKRPDCTYEFHNGKYKWRTNAKFHSEDDLEHDLGASPNYSSAKVLLTEKTADFRYFRNNCPIPYRMKYPSLAAFVHEMTQGHRNHLTPALETEVKELIEDVFRTPETLVESPRPRRNDLRKCSGDEGDAKCSC